MKVQMDPPVDHVGVADDGEQLRVTVPALTTFVDVGRAAEDEAYHRVSPDPRRSATPLTPALYSRSSMMQVLPWM